MQLLMRYLLDRRIQIKINDTISEPIVLLAGAPKGAISSATAFNIWVHDVPQPRNHERSKLSQFADDLGSWCNGKRVAEVKNGWRPTTEKSTNIATN